MYSLNSIRKINDARCAKPAAEETFTRHCSHAVSVKDGVRSVVLHSAKHRNTAFITGATATRFLAELQAENSDTRRDAVIERYYNAVPTGKQRIIAAA
jgi:hypothetical protein